MNVLSLFDGMSCANIALERSGIAVDNYFASEINKHSIMVTNLNYPNTRQVGDVFTLDVESLPNIDILVGGSPCQGFSFSGKMKGALTTCDVDIVTIEQYLKLKEDGFSFSGQSFLFWEYIRILVELKKTNPNILFLLENVRMKDKWRKIITEAIGFDCVEINSKLVSAQSRNRLYWSNIQFDIPEDKKIVLQDILIHGKAHRAKSKTVRVGGRGSNDRHEWDIADDSGRRYSLVELERLQTIPDNYTSCVCDTQRHKMIGNAFTVDVVAHILEGIR